MKPPALVAIFLAIILSLVLTSSILEWTISIYNKEFLLKSVLSKRHQVSDSKNQERHDEVLLSSFLYCFSPLDKTLAKSKQTVFTIKYIFWELLERSCLNSLPSTQTLYISLSFAPLECTLSLMGIWITFYHFMLLYFAYCQHFVMYWLI